VHTLSVAAASTKSLLPLQLAKNLTAMNKREMRRWTRPPTLRGEREEWSGDGKPFANGTIKSVPRRHGFNRRASSSTFSTLFVNFNQNSTNFGRREEREREREYVRSMHTLFLCLLSVQLSYTKSECLVTLFRLHCLLGTLLRSIDHCSIASLARRQALKMHQMLQHLL
jgi:hypothetical protein